MADIDRFPGQHALAAASPARIRSESTRRSIWAVSGAGFVPILLAGRFTTGTEERCYLGPGSTFGSGSLNGLGQFGLAVGAGNDCSMNRC